MNRNLYLNLIVALFKNEWEAIAKYMGRILIKFQFIFLIKWNGMKRRIFTSSNGRRDVWSKESRHVEDSARFIDCSSSKKSWEEALLKDL